MTKSLAFISLTLAALVGCGGDEPKKPVITVDAPGSGSNNIDAPPSTACTMAATVAGPTALEGQYAADIDDMTAGGQEGWLVAAPLNMDTLLDGLQIELYEGFTSPTYTAPVTVQLTGAELSYATCGACVRGLTDVAADGSAYVDDYFASAGSINFTALSATEISGSATGLRLTHVTIDEMTLATTPVGDCDTTVSDFTFTGTVMAAKDGRKTFKFNAIKFAN